MDSLTSFTPRKLYRKIHKPGDRLAKIEPLIDRDPSTPIIQTLHDNQGPQEGRPNIDPVMMVKMLSLQQWYGLSDPELERRAADRISFRSFLGFPDVIPDATTVWLFRERLAESRGDRAIWEELQRQLDEKRLRVKKEVVQDASFITSDPGRHGKPRGGEARTRRSRDGDWSKKGDKFSFGFKLHIKPDVGRGLIRDLETTTSSVHDSQVDLSRPGEVVYLDKAYFGVEIRGYSAAMRRAVWGRPLDIRDKLRNKRINRKRAPGERPFAVIKLVFGSGHVLVTTVKRVHVEMVFACLCLNLVQLGTLAARS